MSSAQFSPPDDSWAATVEVALWTEIAVAAVFVCLRLWSRSYKSAFGWDDAFMIASWLCFLSDGIALQYMIGSGSTRHWVYLSLAQQEYMSKVWIIILFMGISCTCFGKMAIGHTILRLIGDTSQWQKWAVIFVVVVTIISSVVDMLLTAFRCGNPQAVWDFGEAATAKCLPQYASADFNYFAAAWPVFADFFFSILPMAVVWQLRISPRRKIYLMIALGLTLLTGTAGTLKTVALTRLDPDDESWGFGPVITWYGVEAMLINVCGSAPMLGALSDRFAEWWQSRSAGGGGSLQGAASGSGYTGIVAVGPPKVDFAWPRPHRDPSLTSDEEPARWNADVGDVELALLTNGPAEPAASWTARPRGLHA